MTQEEMEKKIKDCEYCSNSRTYEFTEDDMFDSHFCYDDEHDMFAKSIFMSEDKKFDIMIVTGCGKPTRLEFRQWNNDLQRWTLYDIKYLKRCFNCGREITEYPEFKTLEDKRIAKLEEENKEFDEVLSMAVHDRELYEDKYKNIKQQLKSLPKKICDEIRKELAKTFIFRESGESEINKILNDIQDKFEKE